MGDDDVGWAQQAFADAVPFAGHPYDFSLIDLITGFLAESFVNLGVEVATHLEGLARSFLLLGFPR